MPVTPSVSALGRTSENVSCLKCGGGDGDVPAEPDVVVGGADPDGAEARAARALREVRDGRRILLREERGAREGDEKKTVHFCAFRQGVDVVALRGEFAGEPGGVLRLLIVFVAVPEAQNATYCRRNGLCIQCGGMLSGAGGGRQEQWIKAKDKSCDQLQS